MEKPLSMDTFEEVTAVSEALKAEGTITSVGYMLRYVKGVSLHTAPDSTMRRVC